MSDTFTTVTRQSWISRVGSAIKGVFVGLILIVISIVLLWWNEGRAVKTYQALREGGKTVVPVAADRVDPGMEGKLVHVMGKAVTGGVVSDDVFGVAAPVLVLSRTVEMYQWKEKRAEHTRKNIGGSTETETTYTYSKAWEDDAIDSSEFKNPAGHQNPQGMPVKSESWAAQDATLGAFRMPESLVRKISAREAWVLPTNAVMAASVPGKITLQRTGFYIGETPASPQVGDVRVSYSVALPCEVSLVSKQVGDTFEAYTAKNGERIELLQAGAHSPGEMFQQAQQNNKILTWILRGAGFLFMLIGLAMMLAPLSVVADLIPFIGSIVGVGTGVISFLIALSLSSGVIALAWLAYRPVLGGSLLAITVLSIVAVSRKMKKARPASTTQAV